MKDKYECGKDKEKYDLYKVPDPVIIQSLREQIISLEKRIENQTTLIYGLEKKVKIFRLLKEELKIVIGVTTYESLLKKFEKTIKEKGLDKYYDGR